MTLYEILGIDDKASTNDIKRAYFNLAKIHHPDKGGDPDRFQEIHDAYKVLSDDEKRKIYDETGTISEDDMNAGAWILSQLTLLCENWLKGRVEGRITVSFMKFFEREMGKRKHKIEDMYNDAVEKKAELDKYKGFAKKAEGINIFQETFLRLEGELSNTVEKLQTILNRTELLMEEIKKYTFTKFEDDTDEMSLNIHNMETFSRMFKENFNKGSYRTYTSTLW